MGRGVERVSRDGKYDACVYPTGGIQGQSEKLVIGAVFE